MVRHSPKCKILLDEGLAPRNKFKRLNSYFDVKHIALDLGKPGASDEEVYQIAFLQGRLLVTLNTKDFKNKVGPKMPTVIGISPNILAKQIDIKLTSKLKALTPGEFLGKLIIISGEAD